MALVFNRRKNNNSIGIIDQGFCSRILSAHVFTQDNDAGRVFLAFLQLTPAGEPDGKDRSSAVEMINYNMNLLLHISVGSKDVRASAIKLINRAAAPVSLLAEREADSRLMGKDSSLKAQVSERAEAGIAEGRRLAEKLATEAAQVTQVVSGAQAVQAVRPVEATQGVRTIEAVQAAQATQVVPGAQAVQAVRPVEAAQGVRTVEAVQAAQEAQGARLTGVAKTTDLTELLNAAKASDTARASETSEAAEALKKDKAAYEAENVAAGERTGKTKKVRKRDDRADTGEMTSNGVTAEYAAGSDEIQTEPGIGLKRESETVTPGSILRKYAFSGMLTMNSIGGFNTGIYQYGDETTQVENGPDGLSSASRIFRYVQEDVTESSVGRIPQNTAAKSAKTTVQQSHSSDKAQYAEINDMLLETTTAGTPVRSAAEAVSRNSEAGNVKEKAVGSTPAGAFVEADAGSAARIADNAPSRIVTGPAAGTTEGNIAVNTEGTTEGTTNGNTEVNAAGYSEGTAWELSGEPSGETVIGETVKGRLLYNNANTINWVHLFRTVLPDAGIWTDETTQIDTQKLVQSTSTVKLSERIWKSAVKRVEVFIPSILKLDQVEAYSNRGTREFEQLLHTEIQYRGSTGTNSGTTAGTIKAGIIQLLESTGSIFSKQYGYESRFTSTPVKMEYESKGDIFSQLLSKRKKKTESFPFLLVLKTLKLYRASLKGKDSIRSYYGTGGIENAGANASVQLLFENGEQSALQLNDINRSKSQPVIGKLIYIDKKGLKEEIHQSGQEEYADRAEIDKLKKMIVYQPEITLSRPSSGTLGDTDGSKATSQLRNAATFKAPGIFRDTEGSKTPGIFRDRAETRTPGKLRGMVSAPDGAVRQGAQQTTEARHTTEIRHTAETHHNTEPPETQLVPETQQAQELRLVFSRSGGDIDPVNEIASRIWRAHSKFTLKGMKPSVGQDSNRSQNQNRNRLYRISHNPEVLQREASTGAGDVYGGSFGAAGSRPIHMFHGAVPVGMTMSNAGRFDGILNKMLFPNAGTMDVMPVTTENRNNSSGSVLRPESSYQTMTGDYQGAPIVYRKHAQNAQEAVNSHVDTIEPIETKTKVINDTVRESIEIRNDKKNAAVDIEGLANKVYRKLEDRLRTERQRRGLFR